MSLMFLMKRLEFLFSLEQIFEKRLTCFLNPFIAVSVKHFLCIGSFSSCAKSNTFSELSNYSAVFTNTHYVMNIPIYGIHTQLVIFPTPNTNGEVLV